MSKSGRVATVKIQNDDDPDDIRTLNGVKLTLTNSRSSPKLIITIASDEEIELNLKDCSYVEESSEPGIVDCIRNDSEGQTVIIMDKKSHYVDLLDKMRDYLTNGERSSSPLPPRHSSSPHRSSPLPRRTSPPRRRHESMDNKNVNDLISALKDGNEDEAARIARALAREQQPVRFALNMINESGKAAPRPKPEPVQEPIKLKLAIESFLIENNNNQLYDVAILPQTTIRELKELVHKDAGITPDQQNWYINRDLLSNEYVFDVNAKKPPRVEDNKTVLILYISKPQNA